MKKLFMGLLLIVVLAAGAFLFVENRGTSKISTKYDKFNFLTEDKDIDKDDFCIEDGMIYLSLDYIKEYLDKGIEYDESTGEVKINNNHANKILKLNEYEAKFNSGTIDLRAPVIEKNGKIMLPIEAFIYDYDVRLRYNKDIRLLLLDYRDKEYDLTKTTSETLLRESASKRSPIIKKLPKGEELYVYEEKGKFYKVRMPEGYAGYVLKKDLDENFEKVSLKSTSKNTSDGPINLTWDYTYAEHSEDKINQIKDIKGLDVIIPTWFSIRNGNGDMIDRGNQNYIKKYKDLGIDVWAYLDNSFDPNITHEALSNENTRKKVINKTLELCKKYGMKGINIDFEHTKIDDRDYITDFVREFRQAAGDDFIITVDVTPQISADVTKEPYDRKALAEIADYMVVMAYDQHWGSSDKAGSVAQYKWVEGSVNVLFRNIPNKKMILGVPLYTRIWKEVGGKVTSKTISMDEVARIIAAKGLKPVWDKESQQNYIEYQENNADYKIWIEDANSLEKKVSLVNKYNLAGVGSWRLGFETPNIWDVISKELDKTN
ncbi:MAG: glycosyl hydrolase family 18 protein [Peptoniphilus harei]|uniref:SH3 domain protein n=1 Tax=Peptoniphilus harei ACS-146-V-Sch2b TaxID=908338 RepID=E4KZ42_9FIRM|nr:glycosyl hydrolase family 18 protein [Peptoniphilus harei]EFR32934.1 SH3 domain protein [Peptoniphilus harei ACS-146-V-Sch2b]MDK7755313.1 glycosyl hydrolase family 18 protein [Peptoniphilus harei]MDK7761547.1 glycosyl hydrolase family 18 protein [Peptoniphilus harei]MDK8271073.1 glycosyl hydrolase family 18 protein [Peptoniphilus harei]MDK8339339.1 glycosyl hydrolase family 18 protein [Peptoniphilus harei]